MATRRGNCVGTLFSPSPKKLSQRTGRLKDHSFPKTRLMSHSLMALKRLAIKHFQNSTNVPMFACTNTMHGSNPWVVPSTSIWGFPWSVPMQCIGAVFVLHPCAPRWGLPAMSLWCMSEALGTCPHDVHVLPCTHVSIGYSDYLFSMKLCLLFGNGYTRTTWPSTFSNNCHVKLMLPANSWNWGHLHDPHSVSINSPLIT